MSDTTAQMKSSRVSNTAQSASSQECGEFCPSADLIEYAKSYAREKPEVAALWCLGVGFILGWKLKPW